MLKHCVAQSAVLCSRLETSVGNVIVNLFWEGVTPHLTANYCRGGESCFVDLARRCFWLS